MKIFRWVDSATGDPQVGLEVAGAVRPAAALFQFLKFPAGEWVHRADLTLLAAMPQSEVASLSRAITDATAAIANSVPGLAAESLRLLSPVDSPQKFICIGLNYTDHATEQGKQPPSHPMIFAKYANAIQGHGGVIRRPPITTKLDYEGELGVVIGISGKGIRRADALGHVLGYTIIHDVSARDLQKADGQFTRAKTIDGFAPMGPCLVTADEIPDPQTLTVQTRLNGEVMQDSTTANMIFTVANLIEFISQAITLVPGDVIATGTPAGVGAYRTPPVFLRHGDTVDITIDRIGTLTNKVEDA